MISINYCSQKCVLNFLSNFFTEPSCFHVKKYLTVLLLWQEVSKEISDLKSLCLDGFAMVEDCKMREQRNTDAQYVQLLRNRALDPKSLATMRNLQQQQQLLDQGLRDVDAILDQEWEDYQNKKKKRQGLVILRHNWCFDGDFVFLCNRWNILKNCCILYIYI